MDEASIIQHITDTFNDVNVDTAAGDTFFSCDPDRKFPFATIVTKDNDFDSASKLDRPSVFRLNIGISKSSHRSLFGSQPSRSGADGVVDAGHDFTVLDLLLPHPMYGQAAWVCVLNPSAATFQTVRPLLAEAYDLAISRQAKREARG